MPRPPRAAGPLPRLVDAQSSAALLDTASAMLASPAPFTPAHASTAVNLLGKLALREGLGSDPFRGDERYHALIDASAATLPATNARSLVGFAIAFADMRAVPPADWLERFWAAAVAVQPPLPSREVALIFSRFGALGCQPSPPFLDAAWRVTAPALHELDVLALGDVLRAVTTLSLLAAAPADWTQALWDATAAMLPRAAPAQVANFALGCSKIGAPPPEWAETLLNASEKCMPAFRPQGLSKLLVAVGRLKLQPSAAWIDAFGAASAATLPSLDARELLSLATEMRRSGLQPPAAWIAALHAASAPALRSLDAAARPALVTALKTWPPEGAPEGWEPPGAMAPAPVVITRPARAPAPPAAPVAPAPLRQLITAAVSGSAPAPAALAAFWALPPAELRPAEQAGALRALGKLRLAPPAAWLAAFWTASAAALPELAPAELTWLLAAAGQLGTRPPAAWQDAFFARSATALPSYSAAELSASLLALSRLAPGVRAPTPWLQACWSAVDAAVPSFNAQDHAECLSALAALPSAPPDTLRAALWAANAACLDGGSAPDARAAAQLLSTVAQASLVPPDGWLAAFWRGSAAALPTASTNDCVNVIRAAAKLGAPPPEEWQAAYWARAAVVAPKSGVWRLSQSAWAAAQLRMLAPPSYLDMFWDETRSSMASCEAPIMSNLIWAAARIAADPPPRYWMSAYFERSANIMDQFDGAYLSHLLASIALVNAKPTPVWLRRFWPRSAAAMRDGPRAHAAHVLYSLGKLDIYPPVLWLEEALRRTGPVLGDYEPDELASLLFAITQLGSSPTPEWLKKWFAASHSSLTAMSATALTSCVWACARVDMPPPEDWLRQYWAAQQRRTQDATAVELVRAVLAGMLLSEWDAVMLYRQWEVLLRRASAGEEGTQEPLFYSLFYQAWQLAQAEGVGSGLPTPAPEVLDVARAEWQRQQRMRAVQPLPSLHAAVSGCLARSGMPHVNAAYCEHSERSISIALEFGDRRIALMIDGPKSVLQDGRADGLAMMRNRLLRSAGWDVVTLTYARWARVPEAQQPRFLQALLGGLRAPLAEDPSMFKPKKPGDAPIPPPDAAEFDGAVDDYVPQAD